MIADRDQVTRKLFNSCSPCGPRLPTATPASSDVVQKLPKSCSTNPPRAEHRPATAGQISGQSLPGVGEARPDARFEQHMAQSLPRLATCWTKVVEHHSSPAAKQPAKALTGIAAEPCFRLRCPPAEHRRSLGREKGEGGRAVKAQGAMPTDERRAIPSPSNFGAAARDDAKPRRRRLAVVCALQQHLGELRNLAAARMLFALGRAPRPTSPPPTPCDRAPRRVLPLGRGEGGAPPTLRRRFASWLRARRSPPPSEEERPGAPLLWRPRRRSRTALGRRGCRRRLALPTPRRRVPRLVLRRPHLRRCGDAGARAEARCAWILPRRRRRGPRVCRPAPPNGAGPGTLAL